MRVICFFWIYVICISYTNCLKILCLEGNCSLLKCSIVYNCSEFDHCSVVKHWSLVQNCSVLHRYSEVQHCRVVQHCSLLQHCSIVQYCRVVQHCSVLQHCSLVQYCKVVQHCSVLQHCSLVQHCRVVQQCRILQHCSVDWGWWWHFPVATIHTRHVSGICCYFPPSWYLILGYFIAT